LTRSIQITNASPFFEPPARCDLRVTTEGTPQSWAEEAARLLRPVFDFRKPTALMLGRYQPLHDGHKALIVEAIQRVGQVCIAVRDTHGTDEKTRSPSSMCVLASSAGCAATTAVTSWSHRPRS
jgi:hypothetical protein